MPLYYVCFQMSMSVQSETMKTWSATIIVITTLVASTVHADLVTFSTQITGHAKVLHTIIYIYYVLYGGCAVSECENTPKT